MFKGLSIIYGRFVYSHENNVSLVMINIRQTFYGENFHVGVSLSTTKAVSHSLYRRICPSGELSEIKLTTNVHF